MAALLGGDTAALSGLYARLCHAFLVVSFPQLLLAALLPGQMPFQQCKSTEDYQPTADIVE